MKDQKEMNQEIKDEKLDRSNESKSKEEFKSSLYSWNPNKSQRGSLRRKRDSYIKRILDLNERKEIEKRNDLLMEFNNEFYKKNYLLNDFSIESLGYKNMGLDSKENLDNFLSIIKRWKIELK